MIIESPQNSNYKFWKNLKRKKYRNINNLFIVEGKKLYREALFSDIIINSVIISESFSMSFFESEKVKNLYILTDSLFKDLSTMEHSEGILCICEKKKIAEEKGDKVVILDGIKDPGNAGTIIRSAEAFGFTDCIFINDSVDPYNSKVIRGSMGSFFRVRITEEDNITTLISKNYKLLALDMAGKALSEYHFQGKIGLIIGSEAHGVSTEMRDLVDDLISIPMKGKVESLNAGIAASITMYELNNRML